MTTMGMEGVGPVRPRRERVSTRPPGLPPRYSFLQLSPIPVLFLRLPVPALAGPSGRRFDGVAPHEPVPNHGAVRRADALGVEPDPVALDSGIVRSISEIPREAPLGDEPAASEDDSVLIARLFPFFS